MSEEKPVLSCRNIKKTFPTESENGRLEILNDVNLDIAKSEITAIVGSSGCGKSTLLHILGGLDKADSGEVWWGDSPVHKMNQDQLAEMRNSNIGFVFQFHHLLPEFTALENVMMPALIRGTSKKEAEDRAKKLLDRFGLSGRLDHRPSKLSGGEQQRVSMARALTNNPPLILADEPTGNLDETNTNSILSLLFELRETDNVSILLITHEKEIAGKCDFVYTLQNGVLAAEK